VTAPRVLIADDHPLIRVGVRGALQRGGWIVCAEATNAADAVEAAVRERPDACLLDIRMPGGGISAAAEITENVPESAVVMLTVSRDDADLLDALRAGAVGYLLKDTDPDRLPLALRSVLEGEAPLPRHLVSLVADEFRGRARRTPLLRRHDSTLTEQEWEVVELMSAGYTTFEIADRLFIEPSAVRAHVASILEKLQVPSARAAVRLLGG
jgi:DNA-binding NarL/FixJ family response regulator